MLKVFDQIQIDELDRAAIEIVLKDGVVAGFQMRQQQGGDGRHTRAEDRRGLTPLQGGELAGDNPLVGRVEVTRVLEPPERPDRDSVQSRCSWFRSFCGKFEQACPWTMREPSL